MIGKKRYSSVIIFIIGFCTFTLKGQLQRFDKLSLFDRFRHIENIIFWKFVFVFLL